MGAFIKWLPAIGTIAGALVRLFGGKADRFAGLINGAGIVAAAVAAAMWLLGDGREISVTLNLLELAGLVLLLVFALEFQRRTPPPGAPPTGRVL